MQTITLSVDDDTYGALTDLVSRLSTPTTVDDYVLAQLQNIFAAEVEQYNQRQIDAVLAALKSMTPDQRDATRAAITQLVASASGVKTTVLQ